MPLQSQVTFSQLLTNVSIQFQPTQGGYQADMVAPPVPVSQETATYWVYDKSRFDVPDSKREPRSSYNRIDWSTTQDTYTAEEYGLEGEIDDRERRNAAAPLDLDVDTTEIVTDMVLNNREKRVVDICMSTAVVTQNETLAGTSQWSDTTGVSDPISVGKTARETIFDSTGYRPNKAVIGYKVWEALKLHPSILERIVMSERGIVTLALLAELWEVNEILVGGVLRRTSQEGATEVIADVWGNDALFFYSEARPSLKRASFMYQMRAQELRAFRYREDHKTTDVIRVNEVADEKVVSAELAYLVKDAIA